MPDVVENIWERRCKRKVLASTALRYGASGHKRLESVCCAGSIVPVSWLVLTRLWSPRSQRNTYHDASCRLDPQRKGVHIHEQVNLGALVRRVSKELPQAPSGSDQLTFSPARIYSALHVSSLLVANNSVSTRVECSLTPAWTAAPKATASSGLTPPLASFPKKSSTKL